MRHPIEDNLCIFLHIPKTSGEVIKRNIERTLSKEAVVRTSYEYFESYFNIVEKVNSFYGGRDQFHQYLDDLSPLQKSRIEFLAGHNSYYGIHEHFPKQGHYVTFIRDPLTRTISLYNFELMAWHIYSKKTELNQLEINFLQRIENNFLINSAPPSFEQWLNEIYDIKIPFYYSMSRYLVSLGFKENNSNVASLDRFYYVGITENHQRDAAFIYDRFKVRKLGADQNASTSYITSSNISKRVLKEIYIKNEADYALYRRAIEKNRLFKKNNKIFHWINLKYKLYSFFIGAG